MKVCIINSIYLPYSRGGAEVVVEKIITGFLRQGHQVVLITLGRKPAVERVHNFTIYRVRPCNVFSFLDINRKPTWLRALWHPLDVYNFSGYWQIKKILRQEKPQIVFTHNLKGLGYLVPAAIRRSDCQHVHTIHDVQLSRPSGIILYGQEKPFLILDKVYEKICRKLFGSPPVVISPSRWLQQFYRRLGFFPQSAQFVLPNPIILQRVAKQPASSGASGLRLLFVGQLEAFKGITLLLQACRRLTGDWTLTIVGDGGKLSEIDRLIGGDKRFIRTGWVDRKRVTQLYLQADVTVVPSLCYENSPTVIYESLAANVPVIAADIGGVAELVKDDYNGFTFAAGNEQNLVEVLQHFVDHPETVQRLRKNCFVSVRQYSIDRYIKQLLSYADTRTR